MKKLHRSALSFLVAMLMVFPLIPATVYAEKASVPTLSLHDVGEVTLQSEPLSRYLRNSYNTVAEYAEGTAELSYPNSVILSWDISGEYDGDYIVKLSGKPDMSSAIQYSSMEECPDAVIETREDGLYLVKNGTPVTATRNKVYFLRGHYYYVAPDGKLYSDCKKTVVPAEMGTKRAAYQFDKQGRMISPPTSATTYEVFNLLPGEDYYWTVSVIVDGKTYTSDVSHFSTAYSEWRNYRIDGATNVRDLGGKLTEDGYRVRYGMIYRSGRFNDNYSDNISVTGVGITAATQDLGIHTDLDLRFYKKTEYKIDPDTGEEVPVSDPLESGNLEVSPLGENVNYVHVSMDFNGLTKPDSAVREVFTVLADESNYPVDIHCSIGTDRTGYACYLINALLGVTKEDLCRDYLLSNFGNIEGSRSIESIQAQYIDLIDSYPGDTLAEKTYGYLRDNHGVPEEELDAIIRIMKEPACTHKNEKKTVIAEPSETSIGRQTITCADCHATLREEEIPAIGKIVITAKNMEPQSALTEQQKNYMGGDLSEIGKYANGQKELSVPGAYTLHWDMPAVDYDIDYTVRICEDPEMTVPATCITPQEENLEIVNEGGEYFLLQNGKPAEKGLHYIGGYFYCSDVGGKLICNAKKSVLTPIWGFAKKAYSYDALGRMTDCIYSNTEMPVALLEPGRTYYWTVTAKIGEETVVSNVATVTADWSTPRTVLVDGITNVRDLGGWGTEDGGAVRSGLLYRTARLTKNESTEPEITEKGIKTMNEVLGVKSEIDLRRNDDQLSENGDLTECVLGAHVNYYSVPMPYGSETADTKEQLVEIFSILADESNYPVFFHCSIGTDRTGKIAYLVNALLGVSQEDLYRDYLFSNFGKIGDSRSVSNIENGYVKKINECEGNTLAQKTYQYLHEFIGVPTEDLDSVIRILKVEKATECEGTPKSGTYGTGHRMSEWEYCADTHEDIRTCTRCGKTETRPDTECAHSEEIESVTLEPTCREEGIMTYRCKSCSVVLRREAIGKTNHTYVDGLCSCGRKDPDTMAFIDVVKNSWYENAVRYAYSENLFSGTSADTFSPGMKMSRAMLVTVLWRVEGSPLPENENPFSDVQDNTWYTNAVLWASSENIVVGSGGKFNPDGNVTREQIALIVFKYAEYQEKNTDIRCVLNNFSDCNTVSSWAEEAMEWAVGEGLINGIKDNNETKLKPVGHATRAEVAVILMQYLTN